ncbi:phosphatase PAP2 family protein [Streptococcus loxodontisalivarius]|uniref:Undecaprenyl-diphosphatase n=1 Tax=Streptococcus loxodontisalivarius TaxID=1349415 RepID=A0ABS2PQW1_9STRE|nr:undecaprenyl-diphosphatase [Streptococcus loxodontisalivarius]
MKFAPDALSGFDTSIQSALRGDLPAGLTSFFKTITVVGNTSTQVIIVVLIAGLFYWKKMRREAYFIAGNGILAGLFIISLKHIFQRPRPSISHLVEAAGYSFPSGHSMGTMLILGNLIVIAYKLCQKKGLASLIAILLGLTIFLVGLSRIYLGVHYPSDVLAGFILGFGCLMITSHKYLTK